MKKLGFLMVVALFATALSAFAQNSELFPFGKNKVFGQLNFIQMGSGSNDNVDGTVMYSRTFPLSSQSPVFLEVGGGLSYLEKTHSTYTSTSSTETKISLYSIKVPINIGYCFNFNNSNFYIAPYAGVVAKFHYKGDYKENATTTNIFDDKAYKRFQAGWQVGVDFGYKHFFVGAAYGQDFNDFKNTNDGYSALKWKTFSVNIGARF